MGEEVGPDLPYHLLGNVNHQLVIKQTGRGPGEIEKAHQDHHADQSRYVAGDNIGIDHRL